MVIGENIMEMRQGTQVALYPPGFSFPKLEIPMFDGVNPLWWVRRCERMFSFYQKLEQQGMTIIAPYLSNVGDTWFQWWIGAKEGCRWVEFVDEIYARFRDKNMMDVVEEFNKLHKKDQCSPTN